MYHVVETSKRLVDRFMEHFKTDLPVGRNFASPGDKTNCTGT